MKIFFLLGLIFCLPYILLSQSESNNGKVYPDKYKFDTIDVFLKSGDFDNVYWVAINSYYQHRYDVFRKLKKAHKKTGSSERMDTILNKVYRNYIGEDPKVVYYEDTSRIVNKSMLFRKKALLDELLLVFEYEDYDKQKAQVFFQMSMDYRRNRNIQKALEYLQNAVELNKRGDYFFERAEIRAELLDYLGAIKDYDLAKKYGFDEAYCWYRKAHMYNRLEKPEIAISCFTKALNRDTTLYDAYNSRGTLLYQQKKYNEALQDFNKAAELFPQSFKVFTNRGLVHVKLHNDAEACDDFYKALQLGYSPAEDFLKEYCGYRK